MSRHLDPKFINDLLTGSLKDLLEYVKLDNTLDLQIRENYINIYYRGGNVLKVTKQVGTYDFYFDYDYLKYFKFSSRSIIEKTLSAQKWYLYFPLVKQAMDIFFTKMPHERREFRQLLVRENNYSKISNSTDYFIIDIEYPNLYNSYFSLIAVEWPSHPHLRKMPKNFYPKLVIIDFKYGDGNLEGAYGIDKHITDFKMFLTNSTVVCDFKTEMINLFKQKRKLGLVSKLQYDYNSHEIEEFDDQVEMIVMVVNHDPNASKLKKVLDHLTSDNIYLVASNFSGYGLYKENVFTLSEFIARFSNQIFTS